MRKFNKILILSVGMLFGFFSCKDDSLVIVPEWETGVHGLTVFSASTDDVNFIKGDPSVGLAFDMLWNSIDNKNTVTKIELFVVFNEAYNDLAGNPKVARHGGTQGKLYKTLEGAAVPANKATTSFALTQDDVYALYSTAQFDYGEGIGTKPVWGVGSLRDDRDTDDFKFVDGDTFQVRWAFTTADGRVFDSWSPSVCTEFPGANCSVSFAAVCSQIISGPVGDWTINMADSYGDGWNGAAIRVVVDGVGTNYTFNDGAAHVEVVSVPPGTTTLTFEFVSGDWDSEVTFNIVSPRGNIVAKGGPSPAAGTLTLNLCVDNE
jgi:hypothetical protein